MISRRLHIAQLVLLLLAGSVALSGTLSRVYCPMRSIEHAATKNAEVKRSCCTGKEHAPEAARHGASRKGGCCGDERICCDCCPGFFANNGTAGLESEQPTAQPFQAPRVAPLCTSPLDTPFHPPRS